MIMTLSLAQRHPVLVSDAKIYRCSVISLMHKNTEKLQIKENHPMRKEKPSTKNTVKRPTDEERLGIFRYSQSMVSSTSIMHP